jgi:hypothetical protein
MNIDHIIFSQPISVVWKALGGDPPRRGRARAFYRGSDNPTAISLNDEKNCWHDFVSGEGGGVLDLVCRVFECNRTSALQWVANLSGRPLDNRPLTPAERRTYNRRRTQAEQLARDVADWEHGLELFFVDLQKKVTALISWLEEVGIDPGGVLASPSRGLAILSKADADSLVYVYCELPETERGIFREAGRRDREHAEAIAWVIVSVLSQAARNAAAG